MGFVWAAVGFVAGVFFPGVLRRVRAFFQTEFKKFEGAVEKEVKKV